MGALDALKLTTNFVSMSGNNSKHQAHPNLAPPEHRRTPWPLALVAGLFVIAAFFTWYGTWFGRALSDEDMAQYLADDQKPRKVQHALSQVAEQIAQKDPQVRRWYPQVVKLATSPAPEIRQMAAWVMGQDNTSEEFHAALVGLLGDREVVVRRNAAIQLVRFKDARGLPEIRATFKPHEVAAAVAGRVDNALADGTPVHYGTLLAKIEKNAQEREEVRAPLPGTVTRVRAAEGAQVNAGDTLFAIASDSEFVWEALRALYFIGEEQDLAEVERYAAGVKGMPGRIKEQAAQTAQAIRGRSQNSAP